LISPKRCLFPSVVAPTRFRPCTAADDETTAPPLFCWVRGRHFRMVCGEDRCAIFEQTLLPNNADARWSWSSWCISW